MLEEETRAAVEAQLAAETESGAASSPEGRDAMSEPILVCDRP